MTNRLLVLFDKNLPTTKHHEFLQFLHTKSCNGYTRSNQSLAVPETTSNDWVNDLPHDLTGHSVALNIENRYYSTQVHLLLDVGELEAWKEEFLLDEMKELRDEIKGVIYVTKNIQNNSEYISLVREIKDGIDGDQSDNDESLMFVVVVDDDENHDLEDIGFDSGVEFLMFLELKENEYHEKLGKERIWELLECHDWSDVNKLDQQDGEEKDDMDDEELGELNQLTDMNDLLSKLNMTKSIIAGLSEDERHDAAMNFINDLLG